MAFTKELLDQLQNSYNEARNKRVEAQKIFNMAEQNQDEAERTLSMYLRAWNQALDK